MKPVISSEFGHRWRVHYKNKLLDIFNPDPEWMMIMVFVNNRRRRIRYWRYSE